MRGCLSRAASLLAVALTHPQRGPALDFGLLADTVGSTFYSL